MVTSESARPTRWLSLLATILLGMTSQVLAQGTAEQREACTPDALKLCSDTIPDVDRTTACMKRHEAELSPRCHAAFITPGTGAPIETARSRDRVADTRKRRTADESGARGERSLHPRRGEPRLGEATSADRRRMARGAPTDDYDAQPDDEDRSFARGGPPDEDRGPDIRRFPPGDGPDGGRYADGGPPDGYGPLDDGPRYPRPPTPDDPRLADGPPGDYGAPGRGRYGPPGAFGPPDDQDYAYGTPDGGRVPSGQGHRRARAVIARLCDSGEIDPRTCAVTQRALRQHHQE